MTLRLQTAEIIPDRQTDRQTDKQTDTPTRTDRQTDRRADRHTDTQTHTHRQTHAYLEASLQAQHPWGRTLGSALSFRKTEHREGVRLRVDGDCSRP